MKGLFIYNYDWYEWGDLICVSDSEEKSVELVEKFNEVAEGSKELVTCEYRHSDLRDREDSHYMIKEVQVL